MAKVKIFKSFTPLKKVKGHVNKTAKAYKIKSDTQLSKSINKHVHHATKVFSFTKLFDKFSIHLF